MAQAVNAAIDHNLNLLAAKSNLTIAEAQMLTARLRPNPVVSASADSLDWIGTTFTETNGLGPSQYSFRVDVPFERGGKRSLRMQTASFEQEIATAEFQDAVRRLRLDVMLACVDVLEAKAKLQLAHDNLNAFQRLVEVNQRRFTSGAIPQVELTRVRVAMLQYRGTERAAELAVTEAREAEAAARPQSPIRRRSISTERPTSVPRRRRESRDAAGARAEARPDLRPCARSRRDRRPTSGCSSPKGRSTTSACDGAAARAARLRQCARLFLQRAAADLQPQPGRNRARHGGGNEGGHVDQGSRPTSRARSRAHTKSSTPHAAGCRHPADLLAPSREARETTAYVYEAGATSLVDVLDAQRAFNDTMDTYYTAQADYRRAELKLVDGYRAGGHAMKLFVASAVVCGALLAAGCHAGEGAGGCAGAVGRPRCRIAGEAGCRAARRRQHEADQDRSDGRRRRTAGADGHRQGAVQTRTRSRASCRPSAARCSSCARRWATPSTAARSCSCSTAATWRPRRRSHGAPRDLDLAEKTLAMTQDLYDHQAASKISLQQAQNDVDKETARLRQSEQSLRVVGVDMADEADQGQALAPRVPVRAPMSGVVTQRDVTEGQFVDTQHRRS